MGRRRKISIKKRIHKKQPKARNAPRQRMLDMGNVSSFKFRLRKILEDVEGSDPIFANVNSKSVNLGIEDAKIYIEEVVEQGNLKREKADEIIDLLDRFTKYR
jgi:Fe2+ transport system protein FeoA